MNNSYFLYPKDNISITVPRFHICTWEFQNGTALLEFGCEVSSDSIGELKELVLCLFVPWIDSESTLKDMYPTLIKEESLRLISNDSIRRSEKVNGTNETEGVEVTFVDRKRLCILPIKSNVVRDQLHLEFHLDLRAYQNLKKDDRPNVYCRFSLEPKLEHISTRKNGIGKSTIIYDIKLNERRNIPQERLAQLGTREFCEVKDCFCLNIVPNSYDLTFFDSSTLKNVRSLESDRFNQYLGQNRIREDELLVVFNKRSLDGQFSFFIIFSKERIGVSQFVAAILIDLVSGVLLLFASPPPSLPAGTSYWQKMCSMPIEFWIAILLILATVVIFLWPKLKNWTMTAIKGIKGLFKK